MIRIELVNNNTGLSSSESGSNVLLGICIMEIGYLPELVWSIVLKPAFAKMFFSEFDILTKFHPVFLGVALALTMELFSNRRRKLVSSAEFV